MIMASDDMLDRNLQKLFEDGAQPPNPAACDRLKHRTLERVRSLADQEEAGVRRRRFGSGTGAWSPWLLRPAPALTATATVAIAVTLGWLMLNPQPEALAQAERALEKVKCLHLRGTWQPARPDGERERFDVKLWVDRQGRWRMDATFPEGGTATITKDGSHYMTRGLQRWDGEDKPGPAADEETPLERLFAAMSNPVEWIRRSDVAPDLKVEQRERRDTDGRALLVYHVRDPKAAGARIELSLDRDNGRFTRVCSIADDGNVIYDMEIDYLESLPEHVFPGGKIESPAFSVEALDKFDELKGGAPLLEAEGEVGTIAVWKALAGPRGELMLVTEQPAYRRDAPAMRAFVQSQEDPYFCSFLGLAKLDDGRLLNWTVWFPAAQDRSDVPLEASLRLSEGSRAVEQADVRGLADTASTEELDRSVKQINATMQSLRPAIPSGPQTYADLRVRVAWQRVEYHNVIMNQSAPAAIVAPQHLNSYLTLVAEVGAAEAELARLRYALLNASFGTSGPKQGLQRHRERWRLCCREALSRLQKLSQGANVADLMLADDRPPDDDLREALPLRGEPILTAESETGTLNVWRIAAGPRGEIMLLTERPRGTTCILSSREERYYCQALSLGRLSGGRLLVWNVWFPVSSDREGWPDDATLVVSSSDGGTRFDDSSVLRRVPVHEAAEALFVDDMDQEVKQYRALTDQLGSVMSPAPQTYDELRLRVAWQRTVYWNVNQSEDTTKLIAPEYLDSYIALTQELGAADREIARLQRAASGRSFSTTGDRERLENHMKRVRLCHEEALHRLKTLKR